MLEALTGKDLIIITLIIMNGFLIWRSFGAIPPVAFELVRDLIEPRVRSSETKIDDAIYDGTMRVLGQELDTQEEKAVG